MNIFPITRRYYQVIVIENVSGSSLAKPDTYKTGSISAYVASTYKPGTPYITAEFSSSSFSTSFTIGDGKQYSKSKRKRRNTAGQYTNVGLKADTAYLVFQRAFLTDVRIFVFSHFSAGLADLRVNSVPVDHFENHK